MTSAGVQPTKPSYMELVDGYKSYMDAHNEECLEKEAILYKKGKKHLSSFLEGEYPHKEAFAMLCHAISPYLADKAKSEFGGKRNLLRSVRMLLAEVKSFVLNPDDYQQFLVVLYADSAMTLYKMSSDGARKSVVNILVELHDFLHAHCNRLYTHQVGMLVVNMLGKHLAAIGKFWEAYLITSECAHRTRDADWHTNCTCESKPWVQMFRIAAQYAIKWREARLEKEELDEARAKIADAEAEALRLAEQTRRRRAEKSREERSAAEEFEQLKLAAAVATTPAQPRKVKVEERMAPAISRVHKLPSQKAARKAAFEKKQAKLAEEAAQARAQKAKDEKKKDAINAQRAEPVPPPPTLADHMLVE